MYLFIFLYIILAINSKNKKRYDWLYQRKIVFIYKYCLNREYIQHLLQQNPSLYSYLQIPDILISLKTHSLIVINGFENYPKNILNSISLAIENVEQQIDELSLDETTSESTTTISNDDSSFCYDYNDDSDSLSTISDTDLTTSLSIRSPPKYSV